MSKENFVDNDQFVISYELIHLLHWMIKYESKLLQDLITKSFLQGIEDSLEKNKGLYAQLTDSDGMHNSIVDFLNFAEKHIAAISETESVKQVMHKSMMPVMNRVDGQSVDYETVKSSFLTTVEEGKINEDSNASQQQFFKELLRQWKPDKKVKTVH
jgi:hypothetical protein